MDKTLQQLFFEVKANLEKLDFSKLWHDFKPLKFALYNDEQCFFDGIFVEKTDEFLANTAIQYNGETIAIWKVQGEIDSTILTSKIVHEMFHGFQKLGGECDDLEALYRYKYTAKNLSLKFKENQLICDLLTEFNQDKFNDLLAIRKHRQKLFPYEFNYESLVEQIEGSATFVEIGVLKQLSPDLYEQALSQMKARAVCVNNLVPIRIISYDIGALFLLLLSENNIEFVKEFNGAIYYDKLLETACEQEISNDVSYKVKAVVDNYYSLAHTEISTTLFKNDVVFSGESNLLAVNIYNAVYHCNHIISRCFVMYGNKDDRKIEYGDFVIVTKEIGKLTKIYRI